MSRHYFATVDEGKPVCSADGVTLGRIESIEQGDAYVCPIEGLLDSYGSLLVTCWRQGRQFKLDGKQIDRITDRKVVLDLRVQDLRENAAAPT